ncbi:MAG: hypothetical protein LBH95_06740 [Oscillospiraceae bacterium]|jgi:hypothetical protein|nr:hypothetical protein [Oscillospiraceae bacterium]
MTDGQLAVWAKVIVTAMQAGDMDKVTEIYSKISTMASMEEAAKLEAMIAASS